MKRRTLLQTLIGATLAAGLPGCTANSTSFRTVARALKNSPTYSEFSEDYPDQIPYASIAVSSPDRAKVLLILAKVDGHDHYWVSHDRGLLVTRFGRIIKSVGLKENLQNTRFITEDFLANAHSGPYPKLQRRVCDFSPAHRHEIGIVSQVSFVQAQTIQIGKKSIPTDLFEETGAAADLDWKFQNRFWRDRAGFVWKSEQFFAPNSTAYTLEVTKRPA